MNCSLVRYIFIMQSSQIFKSILLKIKKYVLILHLHYNSYVLSILRQFTYTSSTQFVPIYCIKVSSVYYVCILTDM